MKRSALSALATGAIAAAASLMSGSSSSAAIIPVDPVVAPAGSNFMWTYDTYLTILSQVQTGDYFIIYDFGGYVAGSIFTPSAAWVGSTSLVTAPPPGVTLLEADNPGLTNLVFTYVGAPTIVNPSFLASVGLGRFGAVSTGDSARIDLVAYNNHDNSNPAGSPATGQNAVQVPFGAPIPEPTAVAALALLAPLGLRRRG